MGKVKEFFRNVFYLFRDAAVGWSTDRASIYAAALAYYTIFSLAPLIVFSILIAGAVVSQVEVQREVLAIVTRFAGEDVANLVQELVVANLSNQRFGSATTIISLIILLIGASGVFGQLKTALNKIWGIIPTPPLGWRGILFNIRTRVFTFLLVFGMGLLLLVFVIVDTFLSTLNAILGDVFPALPTLPPVTSIIAPLFMLLFFAVIFKTLPDVHLRWRTVWWGALVTTVLFVLGARIIGLILIFTSTGSVYGAVGNVVGTLIVLLIWIYYSAQIVFFGAEFTKSFAIRFGASIQPRLHARLLHEFYEEYYNDWLADAASERAVEVVAAAAAVESEKAAAVQLAAEATEVLERGYVSPQRLAFRQAAAALLGLAAGLFLGFLSSLRRDR